MDAALDNRTALVNGEDLHEFTPEELAEYARYDKDMELSEITKRQVHEYIAAHSHCVLKLTQFHGRQLERERQAARLAGKPTTPDGVREKIDAALHVGRAVLDIPKPEGRVGVGLRCVASVFPQET